MSKKTEKIEEQFDCEELVALARLDMEQSRLDRALSRLKCALVENASHEQANLLIARVYAQLGLFDRAESGFKVYLQANPEAIVERFQLGMSLFDSGNSKDAVAAWESVLKTEPTYPPALFYKALANANGGNAADALKSLEILIKSAPVDNLYLERGRELMRAIESGQQFAAEKMGSKNKAAAGAKLLPKDAYQN